MATREANLETALDNIAQQLADVTAHPKPNYSIDGQSVSWSDHLRNLLDAQKMLREALVEEQGPFEVHSVGRT